MRIEQACKKTEIKIGRTSENEAEIVRFDVSAWPDLYGAGGSFVLVHKRPGDTQPYVCAASVAADGWLEWIIQDTDVQNTGQGEAQLTYVVSTVVAKSAIFTTRITRSLEQAGELPEPYENMIDELIETAANITTEANRADAAKTAAQTAQGKAEDAQSAAETAQGLAEDAQTAAETAQGLAEDAKMAAEEWYTRTAQTGEQALADINQKKDESVLAVAAAGAEQIAEVNAEGAVQIEYVDSIGTAKVEEATLQALKAEGYAVGKQDGVAVWTGEYFENNAKFYNDQAGNKADAAAQSAANAAANAELAAQHVYDIHVSGTALVVTESQHGFTMTVSGTTLVIEEAS